jgi:hypothetical protein
MQIASKPTVPINKNAQYSMYFGLGGWLVWAITFCLNLVVGLATLGIGTICLIPLAIIPYLGWIPAVYTGHKALREIQESEGVEQGRGMAITGLVSGYIALGLTVLLCLVTGIMAATGVSLPIIDELLQQLGG